MTKNQNSVKLKGKKAFSILSLSALLVLVLLLLCWFSVVLALCCAGSSFFVPHAMPFHSSQSLLQLNRFNSRIVHDSVSRLQMTSSCSAFNGRDINGCDDPDANDVFLPSLMLLEKAFHFSLA